VCQMKPSILYADHAKNGSCVLFQQYGHEAEAQVWSAES